MKKEKQYALLTAAEKRLINNFRRQAAVPTNGKNLTTLQKQLWRKIIYYEIKRASVSVDAHSEQDFTAKRHVLDALKEFTPREFMQIFPIDKNYHGLKSETKDYYYTMNMINEQGLDKPIDEPYAFLMDYANFSVIMFVVKFTTAMSDHGVRNGQPSLWKIFFNDLLN